MMITSSFNSILHNKSYITGNLKKRKKKFQFTHDKYYFYLLFVLNKLFILFISKEFLNKGTHQVRSYHCRWKLYDF